MPYPILFAGDPHGVFEPILRVCATLEPGCLILLGDQDLDKQPLRTVLAPVFVAGWRVHWIMGNHDADTEARYDHLAGDHPEGDIGGLVVNVEGVRIAGLGGVFKPRVWSPATASEPAETDPPQYETRADFFAALRPGEAWRGGLPLWHRDTIFPEDFAALARQRFDVLVTHEAPGSHKHGVPAIGELAASGGARLIVHGHHHQSYTATLASGIAVRGLRVAETWQLPRCILGWERMDPSMQQQTTTGRHVVDDVARRHGFSSDAVRIMLGAVAAGRGGMAQFDHPEFGGSGQWMRGGMTMIGDMSNGALKARVIALCEELAPLAAEPPIAGHPGGQGRDFRGEADWWPAELGSPDGSGAQNGVRYAYFAEPRRLAVDAGGGITLYDTGEHRIGGVSQQQSGGASLTFTSQHGAVDLASLPVVSGGKTQMAESMDPAPASASASGDVLGTIEKLAELHAKGIISADEFSAKKADLLGRL